ncbi:hypothetical protein BM43_7615 (plasmid) [Burkholderia gladioli]|nr:hypothetical protein BM43_7615 [Burkholderia gladioli]
MRIACPAFLQTSPHHFVRDLIGIARMSRRVGLLDRRENGFLLCQMASLDFALVEYLLFYNIRRPSIPGRIFVLEPNRCDGACAHVGATPAEASGPKKFQANVEVGQLHCFSGERA